MFSVSIDVTLRDKAHDPDLLYMIGSVDPIGSLGAPQCRVLVFCVFCCQLCLIAIHDAIK